MERILAGTLVVDLTHLVAGPVCTRTLADLGARVVRIDRIPGNRPERGRQVPNVYAVGKESIALDLKRREGRQAARELAARADVLVENLRPGALEALGLGYEELRARNPKLVYASISGFGRLGGGSKRPAFGATAHAEAGFLWVQQRARGDEAPFAPGIQVADIVTGTNAAMAILAALLHRQATGHGQRVDVSLMDSQLAMLGEIAGEHLNGDASRWQPFRHPIHRSKDGRYFTVNIGWPHNWARLARGLGHPEEQGAPPEDANGRIGAWIAGLSSEEVVRGLEAEGAPYGLVMSMEDAVAHQHFARRGTIVEVGGNDGERMRVVRSPLFFSDADASPGSYPRPAGADTRTVLARDLGYAVGQIEEMIASGAAASSGGRGLSSPLQDK